MTYDLSFTDRHVYPVGEHRILVPVKIRPSSGIDFEITALLDSGAEISVFSRALLPHLGIADVTVGGLDTEMTSLNQVGTSEGGYIHDVEVGIFGRTLTIPVAICPTWPDGIQNVLGMEGFFDRWHFAFDHDMRRLYYSVV